MFYSTLHANEFLLKLLKTAECRVQTVQRTTSFSGHERSGRFSQLTAPRPPAPRSARFFPTPAHRSSNFLARSTMCSAPLTLRSNALINTSDVFL